MKLRTTAFIILFINFFLSSQTFCQTSQQVYYKHFTGTLDTNMFINFDLFSQNGKLSGYYYYFFERAGNSKGKHYGKTIPVEGTVNGNRIVLFEFGNSNSKFEANIDEDFTISGKWQRRQYEDPIQFSLKEDYSNGSIPLECHIKNTDHFLDLPDVPKNEVPYAEINIVLLYPDKFRNELMKTNYDLAVTSFFLNDSTAIKSPRLLIENITFDFIQSYVTATDGIPNIEKTASFNWVKKIGMEVLYNKNNLLSLKFSKYGFTGGSHGVTISRFRVFNTNSGKMYALKDFFISGYEAKLNEILEDKLRKINGILEDEYLVNSGFFIEKLQYTNNFYINNDGFGFYYNVYEIASYVAGTTELFCTFRELKSLLRENNPFTWLED